VCDWRHGELQRQAWDGFGELELIVFCELLLLLVGRAAILGHEGIHLGIYDLSPRVLSGIEKSNQSVVMSFGFRPLDEVAEG
jgi:hypothetical protein